MPSRGRGAGVRRGSGGRARQAPPPPPPAQVTVSGNKANDKTYFRHVNGRPGSYKLETFNQLQQRVPERIIEKAVKGMLPKGSLGRDIRLHLKVFKGTAHPHEAQKPTDITALISAKPSKELLAAARK